jgi:hypothetical protein
MYRAVCDDIHRALDAGELQAIDLIVPDSPAERMYDETPLIRSSLAVVWAEERYAAFPYRAEMMPTVDEDGEADGVGPDEGQELLEAVGDARNEADEPTFRRLGKLWEVAFGTEVVHGLADRAGLEIIHRLVAAPGQCLSPEALQDRQLIPVPGDEPEGLPGAGMPVLDERACRELDERLAFISETLQPDAQGVTPEYRAALAEEKAYIEAELRSARFGGKDRELGAESTKAVDAARKALDRAFDYLEQAGAEQLAGHLRASIWREDNRFSYNPIPPVNWRT